MVVLGFVAAVVHLEVSPAGGARLLEGGFILVSGILCAVLISLAGRLAVDEKIDVDSKWGILGGGGSGYSVSRPVALLAIFAACLVALIAMGYVSFAQKRDPEPINCVQCCCATAIPRGATQ
jgi:hypothetical protein